ncbi:queuine tRNA-ribosyltransferase accessory subunit 2-like isoform X2 [Neocloeon triangulifer]|uniref:queuine tRNA-ribosyltransferase accessory subunit 2-like isoform X2 n=1 Tax=Neocloeon triangulifer TaxID=2078957 RepID=UPI00286F15D1|nr:queuine tRNA-ribosyltransferase accessory subunit 2-like isoform X2 [Neocloeon triangulifer]XP_059477690.1 queuine tRNA-ribosyltransferase accessory subunit 2-like isoform X2 [Neocloeon triangulifer]
MKFSLGCITKSGRLGSIAEVDRIPSAVFETPLMLLTTKGGTVPHLTHETLSLLTSKTLALQLPLASNLRALPGTTLSKMNVAEFIGMKESLTFCCVNDPLTTLPGKFNNKNSVAVWTNSGRENVTPKSYMDIVEALRPDMYQTLCDSDTNSSGSNKRALHSVNTSMQFFQYCLDRHKSSEVLGKSCILASLVGGFSAESRLQMAKELAGEAVDGFVLEGFDAALTHGEAADPDLVASLLRDTLKLLPEGKVRLLPGCWAPEALWRFVREGVDVFDSSLPTAAAERGAALTFGFDPHSKSFSYSCEEKENSESKVYEISLKEKKYFDCLEPILEGCKCVTCRNHTKAYLHHLLVTQELLGSVLLMMHNLHHYEEFFSKMREAIRSEAT